MSTSPTTGGPGPVQPRPGAALLIALASAIAIAAAAMLTRPDIPALLRHGLSIAGSVFAGVMLIIPVVLSLL